jgi:hypothetical protein
MLDLHEELTKVTRALDAAGVPYALCGGLAMAVYGQPRATVDIDLLAPSDKLESLREVVVALGFSFEARMMEFKSGLRIQRYTKIEGADFLSLDILLTYPDIEKVWEERRTIPWGEGELTVVSREGLIALKEQRQSGQDQDDIAWLKTRKK